MSCSSSTHSSSVSLTYADAYAVVRDTKKSTTRFYHNHSISVDSMIISFLIHNCRSDTSQCNWALGCLHKDVLKLFKLVIQYVLLFVAEKWVVTPRLCQALGSFNEWISLCITGKSTGRIQMESGCNHYV